MNLVRYSIKDISAFKRAHMKHLGLQLYCVYKTANPSHLTDKETVLDLPGTSRIMPPFTALFLTITSAFSRAKLRLRGYRSGVFESVAGFNWQLLNPARLQGCHPATD
jgi:hypothetical protein